MKYLIYKTTNLINNKIYIGMHQTENIDDEYLGSGKLLLEDVKKYGTRNFSRELLFEFDNKEDMINMEMELVDDEFIARLDTYNICLGGDGGWDVVNNDKEFKEKCMKKAKIAYQNKLNNTDFREFLSKKRTSLNKLYYESGGINWFKNKKHTEESKKKIGKANCIHQSGKGNSQYGTCWIFNENLKENKKIKKEDLSEWINKGWIKGRKIKI